MMTNNFESAKTSVGIDFRHQEGFEMLIWMCKYTNI